MTNETPSEGTADASSDKREADAIDAALFHVVVSVNWWKSSWHQPSTSEQLTESLLTPPVN
jgi:hypothetical protein